MIMESLIYLLAGGGGGYYLRKNRRPRHKHDWEVVEKDPVKGTTLDEAIKAANASSYSVSMEDIMLYVQPEGFVVTYRCMCGAGKVQRI